jgi:hypothetical protein
MPSEDPCAQPVIELRGRSLAVANSKDSLMPSRIYYSEEAKRMAQQRQIVGGLAMLLLGIVIGAAIASLFMPEEG